MKITFLLILTFAFLISCQKEDNKPINEEFHEISHHAVVTATITDSLTGAPINGYEVYSLNQNQIISVHELSNGIFSIYCFWIDPQPNSINFVLTDSSGVIARQYIQPIELIENDTLQMNLLF